MFCWVLGVIVLECLCELLVYFCWSVWICCSVVWWVVIGSVLFVRLLVIFLYNWMFLLDWGFFMCGIFEVSWLVIVFRLVVVWVFFVDCLMMFNLWLYIVFVKFLVVVGSSCLVWFRSFSVVFVFCLCVVIVLLWLVCVDMVVLLVFWWIVVFVCIFSFCGRNCCWMLSFVVFIVVVLFLGWCLVNMLVLFLLLWGSCRWMWLFLLMVWYLSWWVCEMNVGFWFVGIV